MKTRILFLPVVFLALCTLASSHARVESSNRKSPQTGVLQVSNKTDAELLVGNWEWIKTEDCPVSGVVKKRSSFTKEGNFYSRTTDPFRGAQSTSGIYTVLGKTIRFSHELEPGQIETWDITIQTISESEMVFAWPPEASGQRYRSKYSRIEAAK